MNELDSLYRVLVESLDHTSRLSIRSIESSAAYILPSFLKNQAKVVRKDGYALLQVEKRTYFVPLQAMTPKEWLKCLMLEKVEKIANVPKPYADALEKTKRYKKAWGTREFLFSTAYLASMKGGQFKECRRLLNRSLESGVTFRLVGQEDYSQLEDCYSRWLAERTDRGARTSFHGYSLELFKASADMPEELRFRVVGAYQSGQMIAYAMGTLVAADTWGCLFSHGTRERSMMNLCWLQLAAHYQDYPYEADGDGVGKGLYINKLKFVTDDVANLQYHNYYVVPV